MTVVVSKRQFTLVDEGLLVAEASDLRFGVPPYHLLLAHHAREVLYVRNYTKRDSEGDTLWWDYQPTTSGVPKVRIYND